MNFGIKKVGIKILILFPLIFECVIQFFPTHFRKIGVVVPQSFSNLTLFFSPLIFGEPILYLTKKDLENILNLYNLNCELYKLA